MLPEKWASIMANIKDNFRVIEEGKQSLDEEGGTDIEYVEFEGPIGLMRLEYVTKPLILDKKTLYSKRIGSETKVEYVYSPDEKTNIFAAYKWDDSQGDWIEIEAKSFI